MITIIALIIAAIGCINWFYIVVGVAGLWLIVHLIKDSPKMVKYGTSTN